MSYRAKVVMIIEQGMNRSCALELRGIRRSQQGFALHRVPKGTNMQTRTRRLLSGDVVQSTAPSGAKPRSILDMNISATRGEVNQDAYLALFSELVSYCRNRVQSVTELEQKLADLGYRIGRRSLELIAAREKLAKRETRLLHILNFISINLWKFLFGKQADSLKKVRNSEAECKRHHFRFCFHWVCCSNNTLRLTFDDMLLVVYALRGCLAIRAVLTCRLHRRGIAYC